MPELLTISAIHSKMSGKIEIYTDNSFETKEMGATSSVENSLYSVTPRDAFDTKYGTTGITEFQAGGAKACSANCVPGTHNKDFETCLQAIDCQMVWDMGGKTKADHTSDIQTFMQQMIPHHQNAVNMVHVIFASSTASLLYAKREGSKKDDPESAVVRRGRYVF